MGELVSGTETSLDALAAKYKAYNNSKLNTDQIDDASALKYIQEHLSNAYYITQDGLYGGQYFQSGINYGVLKSWNELSDSRNRFMFNYDALDVLIDPEYHGISDSHNYANTYSRMNDPHCHRRCTAS